MADEAGLWLTGCEQELLHLPGAIQSWGALLVVEQASLRIVSASANLADFLGITPDQAIRQRLDSLLHHEHLVALLHSAGLPAPSAEDASRLGPMARDVAVHLNRLHLTGRLVTEWLLIEIERSPSSQARSAGFRFLVEKDRWLTALRETRTLVEAYRLAVAHMRAVTGFDRVMLYRFDEIGHGEVVAEERPANREPFLGIKFPASDVPRQARALYLRQRVRVICDIESEPIGLVGEPDITGRIDLSVTALRAVSPIHLQYMRNMAVRATIVVSLIVEGRLWGLLVAHHWQPRLVSPNLRLECDLLGQTTVMALSELLLRENQTALAAKQYRIDELAEQLALQYRAFGDGKPLAAREAAVLSLCDASGAIVRLGGEIVSFGLAPRDQAAAALLDALLAASPERCEPFATAELGAILPPEQAAGVLPFAAGALVLPFQYSDGDTLVWLRPEQAREVCWGGDPSRRVEFDVVSGALLPRHSFAVWREQVRGQSVAWSAADLDAARALRREKERRLAGLAYEMRLERDAAAQATRAKTEFLATMSHEIRSPMSGLLGVLEILRKTDLSDEQAAMATMIHKSATLLLSVLNDILDFSKIEAGALTVLLEPHELRGLLDDLVQPLQMTAAHKGLGLQTYIAPDVPMWIMTDALRLRQILNNLLCNAIKFTANGEISLTVRLFDAAGLPTLRFSVRDSGIGMSEAVVERLFSPFMQAEGSTTRRFGGTGLGLAISRKLAKLMLGELSVTSEYGVGSDFVLTVPLVPTGEADATEPLEGLPPTGSLAPGRSILVVDDDPTIRWLTRRQLEHLGCVVDVAEDGEIGLQKLGDGTFDLLLTDCHMPRMDGVALTRAVRALAGPALRAIPIIGLTADVTEAQRQSCLSSGMSELVIKPLTVDRMEHLLLSHLRGRTAPAPTIAAESVLRKVAFDDQIYLSIFPIGDVSGVTWLRGYQDSAADDCSLLRSLCERPGLAREDIRLVAHRLAGASFSVGAMLLGDAARALEQAALTEEPKTLNALLSALIAAHDVMLAAMAAFLQTSADAVSDS
jgi:light-regulated signal transduction histidine kinase (bacteriophytochrome)/ActR/RegA family two-component response regulator